MDSNHSPRLHRRTEIGNLGYREYARTAHFSDRDLFSVIENNDVCGVEKAVFYMGARIHVVHVWCGRTAMEYAARLGHMEQVKVLLHDLERYFDGSYESNGRLRTLFKELIPHYHPRHKEFFHQLVSKYHQDMSTLIKELVTFGAFDLLEILAKDNERSQQLYMYSIVNMCIIDGKAPNLLKLEYFKDHRIFQKELQRRLEGDALYWSIIMKDGDEMARLLLQVVPRADSNQYICLETAMARTDTQESDTEEEEGSPRRIPFNHCVIKTPKIKRQKFDKPQYCSSKDIPISKFITNLVKMDDVELLQKLLSATVLPQVLLITERTEDELLICIFYIALDTESLKIARTVLSLSKFDKTDFNWNLLYHRTLKSGKLKSAEFIKPQCGDIDQDTRDRLFNEFWNNNTLSLSYFGDKPAEVITDLVSTIDALPSEPPDSRSYWRKCVTHLPMAMGRPDLAEPFQKYGVECTSADIIRNMSIRSCPSYDNLVMQWDTSVCTDDIQLKVLL